MVNDSPFGALSHWQRVYGSQIENKDKQNLTLMTPISKLCQLAQIWLMTLPWEHCCTGSVFMVAKLKKKTSKTNPNDSHFKTLSVGPNMVNDSPLGPLSHWRCVYDSQILKKDKQNLTLMTPVLELCQFAKIWLMTLLLEHCHTGGVFMVAKFKKKSKT